MYLAWGGSAIHKLDHCVDHFEGLHLCSVHRCGQQAMKHSCLFAHNQLQRTDFFFLKFSVCFAITVQVLT